ncbi:MAG: serine/threonine protein kinase, partial [Planctomycetota bacterium]
MFHSKNILFGNLIRKEKKMLEPGTVLKGESGAEYTIIKLHARGGMAHIYLARDGRNKEVVVKVPFSEFIPPERLIGKFLREMAITNSLHHSHIVRSLDQGVFQEHGVSIPFLVTEYKKGALSIQEVLHDRLSEQPPRTFTEEEVQYILDRVCSALSYAHEEDPRKNKPAVYHMDISANNILLTLDPGGQIQDVLLIDFGLGKIAEHTRMSGQRTSYASATLPYQAPEYTTALKRRGKEHLCDQYSLGILAIQMLTSYLPEGGMDAQRKVKKASQVLKEQGISPHLRKILLKMIAKEPHHRYASLKDVQKALRQPPATPNWMTLLGSGVVLGSFATALI